MRARSNLSGTDLLCCVPPSGLHSYPQITEGDFAVHAARSPSLSASPVFDVDVVEVWRVEPPPADDEDGGAAAGRRSVLDKTKEDQEFLGLAGRQMHSAAERD